jgi:hypothetical protein
METTNYVEIALRELTRLKKLADDAIRQVDSGQFFTALDAESNSIAVIVKHIAGNLRSRWTNFLDSDGEKPDRNRDSEFELADQETRDTILNRWEANWQLVFDTMNSLKPEDLQRTITIRSEPYSVIAALNRQLSHNAYHVGQIVFLAKHLVGSEWRTLSVARNKSADFNAEMNEKFQ